MSTSTPTSPGPDPHQFRLLQGGFALCIIFTFLRFLGRKIERVQWWWDDWAGLLSLLIFAGGFWTDLQILFALPTPENTSSFLLHIWVNNLLHPLISGTTKMSGLLLYYLHFGYERRIKIKVYIMLAVVGFWMLVMTLTNILQCQPVTAAWASDGGAGKCIERNTLLQATAVTDAFLNVGVLALTFPGTWRTDWKPWNRGLVITLCYLQGLLVITCSILRAYYAFSYKPTEPFTTFGPYFLWSKIQEAFGIVTVCGWPAGAGLVAVVTCNYREPRASAWASLGKQIRRKMTDDGFGQLLGDSEERTRLESLSREQRQRGDVEALKWSDKIAKLREELDAEAERRTKADILGKPF